MDILQARIKGSEGGYSSALCYLKSNRCQTASIELISNGVFCLWLQEIISRG